MFEYINMGVVILSVIIFLLYISSDALESIQSEGDEKEHKSKKFTIFMILGSLMAPFLVSGYTTSLVNGNIESFKSDKELKCSTTFDKYLVSAKGGWSLKDDSFLKDSLLIRADKCSTLN